MKQHKKFKGFVSIIMALLMMVSVLCCTASAANNSSALSDAISKGLANASQQTTNMILTNTLHPTPDNPLQYAYTVRVSASDPYGRAIEASYPGFYMDFYTSQAAYNAGEKPIATVNFYTDANGKKEVSYIDTFTKDPPKTLFFKMRRATNTYFTPSQGTVAPMLYVDN